MTRRCRLNGDDLAVRRYDNADGLAPVTIGHAGTWHRVNLPIFDFSELSQ